MQRHDGDSVAHELQVLQTVVVSNLERSFAFSPDVFMPDFVGRQGLQFIRVDQRERCFRDEQDSSRMQSDRCLGHVDDLDFVHRVALGGAKYVGQSCKLPPRSGVQTGDLTFLWKGPQDARFVFGRHRHGPGDLQRPGEGAGIGGQQGLRAE